LDDLTIKIIILLTKLSQFNIGLHRKPEMFE